MNEIVNNITSHAKRMKISKNFKPFTHKNSKNKILRSVNTFDRLRFQWGDEK
jgi:hypothetical protein